MKAVAVLLCSYLLGAIPVGLLLVRWLKGVDVRTIGSGNIGATNTARAAGKGIGALVFLLDAGKGALAAALFSRAFGPEPTPAMKLACGALAVVGHCFPVFLGFRGGKGVATLIGMLLASYMPVAVAFILIWSACAAVWGFVSLSSMVAAAVVPPVLAYSGQPSEAVLIAVALAALIVFRHRENIRRLRRGEEPSLKRKRRAGGPL